MLSVSLDLSAFRMNNASDSYHDIVVTFQESKILRDELFIAGRKKTQWFSMGCGAEFVMQISCFVCSSSVSVCIDSLFQHPRGGVLCGIQMQTCAILPLGTVNDPKCSSMKDCYLQTKQGAEKQFALLGQKQLDMLMLDYPADENCDSIRGQWKAFEDTVISILVTAMELKSSNLQT